MQNFNSSGFDSSSISTNPQRKWLYVTLPCGKTDSTKNLVNSLHCTNDSCPRIVECQKIINSAIGETFASVVGKRMLKTN